MGDDLSAFIADGIESIYCNAIAHGFVAGQTLKQKDAGTDTELPEEGQVRR